MKKNTFLASFLICLVIILVSNIQDCTKAAVQKSMGASPVYAADAPSCATGSPVCPSGFTANCNYPFFKTACCYGGKIGCAASGKFGTACRTQYGSYAQCVPKARVLGRTDAEDDTDAAEPTDADEESD